MDSGFVVVGVGVLAAFATYLTVQAVRNGGVRGAMYGAPLRRTVGELELPRRGLTRVVLRVHVLEPRGTDGPAVGMELAMSSTAAFGFTPIPLTSEQAAFLASMLTVAATESRKRD